MNRMEEIYQKMQDREELTDREVLFGFYKFDILEGNLLPLGERFHFQRLEVSRCKMELSELYKERKGIHISLGGPTSLMNEKWDDVLSLDNRIRKILMDKTNLRTIGDLLSQNRTYYLLLTGFWEESLKQLLLELDEIGFSLL